MAGRRRRSSASAALMRVGTVSLQIHVEWRSGGARRIEVRRARRIEVRADRCAKAEDARPAIPTEIEPFLNACAHVRIVRT
jgi:hypothetical protein